MLPSALFLLAFLPAAQTMGEGNLNEKLAPNIILRPLNGDLSKVKLLSLDDYVGNEASEKKKLVLLSFFSINCEMCKREILFLQSLNDAYKDNGLQVLTIDIDKDDAALKTTADFLLSNHITYPVLSDRFYVATSRFSVRKIPLLFFIDSNMKIVEVDDDYTEPVTLQKVNAVRKKLALSLAEPIPLLVADFFKPPQESEPSHATVEVDAKNKTTTVAPKRRLRRQKSATAKMVVGPSKKGPKRIGRHKSPPQP